jgi:hypothetical protein
MFSVNRRFLNDCSENAFGGTGLPPARRRLKPAATKPQDNRGVGYQNPHPPLQSFPLKALPHGRHDLGDVIFKHLDIGGARFTRF